MFQCLVLSQTWVRFRINFVSSIWTHTQSGYEIHSWSATETDKTILSKSVFKEALLWSVLSLLVLFLQSAVSGQNIGFIRHVSQRNNYCCEVCFLSLFCFCVWLLLGKILISLDVQQLLRMCERALTVQDQFMIKYQACLFLLAQVIRNCCHRGTSLSDSQLSLYLHDQELH